MIETTVKSGVTELPKMELQTIICVMYMCGLMYMYVCVI